MPFSIDRVTLCGDTGPKVKVRKGRPADGKEITKSIHDDIETLFSRLRDQLKYKRRDLAVEKSRDGGTIFTPDFEYRLRLERGEAKATWRREISAIRSADVLRSQAFLAVFGETFDTLVIPFPHPRDVAAIVDAVEDRAAPGVKIDYPSDCSWCEISTAKAPARLHITPERLEVRPHRVHAAGELLEMLDAFGPYLK
jgi:hypothetical protein